MFDGAVGSWKAEQCRVNLVCAIEFSGRVLLMFCELGLAVLRRQFHVLGDDDTQTCFDLCKADRNKKSLIIQLNKSANFKLSQPNIGIRKARSRISAVLFCYLQEEAILLFGSQRERCAIINHPVMGRLDSNRRITFAHFMSACDQN